MRRGMSRGARVLTNIRGAGGVAQDFNGEASLHVSRSDASLICVERVGRVAAVVVLDVISEYKRISRRIALLGAGFPPRGAPQLDLAAYLSFSKRHLNLIAH
jgi:hypothetical protein